MDIGYCYFIDIKMDLEIKWFWSLVLNIFFNCNVFSYIILYVLLFVIILFKERKGSFCFFIVWICGYNSFWVFFFFRESMSSDFNVRG